MSGERQKDFGRQCMVVGIDYVKHNNDFYVYDHRSSKITDMVLPAVSEYVERGAGELYVNDVGLTEQKLVMIWMQLSW